MRFVLTAIIFILSSAVQAQEIKSTVQVIAPGVQMTNKNILTTLQNAVQQFINSRKWTEDNFEAREKIEVSFFFNVTALSQDNDFKATLQVSSTRPVLNSIYKTSVFTFSDEDVTFKYRELENIDYQEGQNLHDLSTLIAFYINIVLGYDYDSFGELGGTAYFKKAFNIVNLMSTSAGWRQGDGKGIWSRYNLAENINNSRFNIVRELTYTYHRKGMDVFYENPDEARATVTESLKSLQELVASYGSGSLLQRTFFTTKYSELVEIYKGATVAEKNIILDLLAQLDPTNTIKYQKIKA